MWLSACLTTSWNFRQQVSFMSAVHNLAGMLPSMGWPCVLKSVHLDTQKQRCTGPALA